MRHSTDNEQPAHWLGPANSTKEVDVEWSRQPISLGAPDRIDADMVTLMNCGAKRTGAAWAEGNRL